MKTALILLSLTCSYALSQTQPLNSGQNAPGFSRFVVVGDSLSAGVQNFSLLDTQQPNGYASVIATQAGWPLTLPLVPFPGAPNVLQLVSVGPPALIVPAAGSLPAPRDNPGIQPTNIAVPGLTVNSALTLRPDPTSTNPEQQWATIVLGFPSLLQGKAPTEIELASTLRPNIMIEWLGNNDALVPALAGQLNALTPIAQFAADYNTALDSLSKTGAKLISATVPDVTEIAFFTSAADVAAQAGLPLNTVTSMLGIGPNDYLRSGSQSTIDKILTGQMPGPLPATCPAPLPDLGVPVLPCVLTASDAAKVSATVNFYNLIIVADTLAHGGIVVDIHGLVDNIHKHGYSLNSQTTLTTGFFGGLFSLDGIHPTNTGYGVIANEFIRVMNGFLGTTIPAANIPAIFAADPLARYVQSPRAQTRASLVP